MTTTVIAINAIIAEMDNDDNIFYTNLLSTMNKNNINDIDIQEEKYCYKYVQDEIESSSGMNADIEEPGDYWKYSQSGSEFIV